MVVGVVHVSLGVRVSSHLLEERKPASSFFLSDSHQVLPVGLA